MTKIQGDRDSVFGYTGHFWHGQSGLNLAMYRAYDPGLGRWISRDPLGEIGGINLYGYVGNSVIGAIDLLGLCECTTDDAGRTCCKSELQEITIASDVEGWGHTFFILPDGSRIGWHPVGPTPGVTDVMFPTTQPGGTSKKQNQYFPAVQHSYTACPSSLKLFFEKLKAYRPPYAANNIRGRNCTGWSCGILSQSGFTPPVNPGTWWLIPLDVIKGVR